MTNNTVFKKGDVVELAVSESEFISSVGGGEFFFGHGAIDENGRGVVHEVRKSGSIILEDDGIRKGYDTGGVLFPSETHTIKLVDITS